MLNMLESHMNPVQKADMLTRIDKIERQGLTYTQDGTTKNSKHFSLQPLIDAYNNYLSLYDRYFATTRTDRYKQFIGPLVYHPKPATWDEAIKTVLRMSDECL